MPGRISADLNVPVDGIVQSVGSFAATSNSTPQAIAANGNISLAGPPNPPGAVIVTPGAAVAGITLDIGLVDQQELTIFNNSAFTVTFAAVGASHVNDGAGDVINANVAGKYVWFASVGAWVRS